jgi:hypothetical protein
MCWVTTPEMIAPPPYVVAFEFIPNCAKTLVIAEEPNQYIYFESLDPYLKSQVAISIYLELVIFFVLIQKPLLGFVLFGIQPSAFGTIFAGKAEHTH